MHELLSNKQYYKTIFYKNKLKSRKDVIKMKRKIGIVTLIGNFNFGNRLQNYATQQYINKSIDADVETILNYPPLNNIKITIVDFIKLLKLRCKFFKHSLCFEKNREFKLFNKNIIFSKKEFKYRKKHNFYYDYLVIGSDQVWNPATGFKCLDLGDFREGMKVLSFATSLGVSKITRKIDSNYVRSRLNSFIAISVREDSGKKIIEELTGRKDVEVLVDPTMLLTSDEWDKVSKKPKNYPKKKYILNYFLGNLSEERKKEIERIAKENDCEIVNIMDKKDPLYVSGPSEFLYLEKHAFLICTDSFHSSVFAILYDRPFVIFDREGSKENMGTRLDTLLSKFNLKNRRYNGKHITKENLEHDYTEAYKILEQERKKSERFLKRALDIND